MAVAFPALILPLMAVKAILVFNLNRDLKDIEVVCNYISCTFV